LNNIERGLLRKVLTLEIDFIMFTLRKIVPYQNNNSCPKNGFKCIVLDGIRYIIHINGNTIESVYDAKYKSRKDELKPLSDKHTPTLITKLSNIFFTSGRVNLPSEYIF